MVMPFDIVDLKFNNNFREKGLRSISKAFIATHIKTQTIGSSLNFNIKTVNIEGQLVRTARDIGISFAAPIEKNNQ